MTFGKANQFWVAVCLPILLALFWVHHFWPHLSDDGAIFFRYANNFANGAGPVWNLGDPVEGFSSPFWLLLLTLGQLLGASVEFTAKCLGVGCALGSLFALGLSLRLKVDPIWIAFSILGASLTAGLFYWAPSGMETPLVVLLWVLVWWKWGTNTGLPPLALLGIARPEGPLLVLGALTLWRSSVRELRWFDFLSLVPCGVWLCFRLGFYGEMLPNTYYAKMGASLSERLFAGWSYCYPLLLVWIAAFLCASKSDRVKFYWLLIGLLSVLWGGGDWMWWGRLLVPFSVLLWCTFPIMIEKRWWLLLPFLWGMSHVMLPYKAVLACLSLRTLPEIGFQEGTLMAASREQAEVIRDLLPAGSRIAINHAGFLPYFLPEYVFVDMTGLNDHHIAHNATGALHQKYDANYVLSLKPDAILFHRRTLPPEQSMLSGLDYWAGETALAETSEFQENYAVLGDYWVRKASGGQTVYAILSLRR